MRVLIADDEPDILLVYRMGLEARGHTVTTVGNGEDCLKSYYDSLERNNVKKTGEMGNRKSSSSHSSLFDVVVLDYKMPRKNGLEVAKQILEWTPDQRMIFASAFVEETLRDSISQLKQVVELIQKPFNVNVLVEMIEDMEIFNSVRKLSLTVRQIKDINNPTSKEIRELLKAAARAHKGKTFAINSN